jgi:hypothetical protein
MTVLALDRSATVTGYTIYMYIYTIRNIIISWLSTSKKTKKNDAYIPQEHWSILAVLNGVMSQEIEIF